MFILRVVRLVIAMSREFQMSISFLQQLELLPIGNVFHELYKVSSNQALECDIDELESRYDDLCQAQRLLKAYRETEGEIDDEMRKFSSNITKTLRTFRSAIFTLDADKVSGCLEEYEKALDGNDDEEKFVRHWRDWLKKKVSDNVKGEQPDSLTSLEVIIVKPRSRHFV